MAEGTVYACDTCGDKWGEFNSTPNTCVVCGSQAVAEVDY